MIAHLAPNTSWTLDPLQIVPTLVLAALYTRRVLTLRDRGTPVPAWRIVLFGLGILILLVAFVSPVHALGERMFSFHMLQHVLLGDLAPLALLAGLTGPILRPALRWLYPLRFLANPLVALPIWAVNLYVWHLPFLYDAAVRHDSVHALEHFCFFTGGLIMWLPVLETLPAPEWFGTGAKLGYIAVVRIVETILGNVFFWAGSTFYVVYAHQNRLWGLSALADQGIAGAVMMIEGSIVTLVALAWLFLRMASEGELRQQLLERGLDPRTVKRAVRYGRAEELSRSR
jgi:putative membrane protein